ncbi:MAG: hypothetical protein WBN18_04115 [Flavobacteriaceae bacterium]
MNWKPCHATGAFSISALGCRLNGLVPHSIHCIAGHCWLGDGSTYESLILVKAMIAISILVVQLN